MLEWLGTILGEHYSDDIDKKVSAEIDKISKGLELQISERDNQLNELKKLKPDELQAEITRLQGENTSAKQKYESDLKIAKLEYALDSRLVKEGAVNTKAVKALLDNTKISLDGDNLVGVDDQLKSLKESEKWAFKPETPSVPGFGGNPPPTQPISGTPLPTGTVIF